MLLKELLSRGTVVGRRSGVHTVWHRIGRRLRLPVVVPEFAVDDRLMIGCRRWLWRRLSLLFYREYQVRISTVRKNQPFNVRQKEQEMQSKNVSLLLVFPRFEGYTISIIFFYEKRWSFEDVAIPL